MTDAIDGTPRRARLNRTAVLSAAVELADRRGLEDFTMRLLADKLGVVPMALYKHVTNKEDLLDGMVDLVWGEVELPGDRPWKAALRARSISLREALRRHRWAVGLMESRMRPGFADLASHNAMMGCLRQAGFSFRTTVHCTSALDAYIYGFALQEKTLPFDSPEESGAVAEEKRDSVPEEAALAFPYLIEVVVELSKSGYDAAAEFEVGLDLLLDSIERLRPEWIVGG